MSKIFSKQKLLPSSLIEPESLLPFATTLRLSGMYVRSFCNMVFILCYRDNLVTDLRTCGSTEACPLLQRRPQPQRIIITPILWAK